MSAAAAAAAARAARLLLPCLPQTTTTRLLHASTRAPAPAPAPSHLPLISSDRASHSRQIAFLILTRDPPWHAGASQGAAREASGSFIHPAAVVHPDAVIGQVNPSRVLVSSNKKGASTH